MPSRKDRIMRPLPCSSLRKLIILGLTLSAVMAGVTAPGLAAGVSAAPATPSVAVSARVTTVYLTMPIPGSVITLHRLTLHITGSHFAPGSTVRIAVMHTSPWKLLATASTHAQRAVITAWCPGHYVCSAPNPRAGTIDYRMRFSYAPAASSLVVLYRSAGHTGMHDLALRQR